MPRKPRAAPTAMKTVPSGRFDFCMKGAADVSGTIKGGTPTPWSVGKGEPVDDVEEVNDGSEDADESIPVEEAVDAEPVDEVPPLEDVDADSEDSVVVEDEPSEVEEVLPNSSPALIVLKLGRLLSCCANVVKGRRIARRRIWFFRTSIVAEENPFCRNQVDVDLSARLTLDKEALVVVGQYAWTLKCLE